VGTYTAHFFCLELSENCIVSVKDTLFQGVSFFFQCLGMQGIVAEVLEFCSSSVFCKLLRCNGFESRRLHQSKVMVYSKILYDLSFLGSSFQAFITS